MRCIAICLLCLAGPLLAAQLTTPTARYPTIQSAIDAALAGDEVVVSPGTHEEAIDFLGKAITVRSLGPDDPAVVEATILTALDQGPCVSFVTGENAGATLLGLTISDTGDMDGYGGIRCRESSPTIRKCVITSNLGRHGAGIFCYGGAPTIEYNDINSNVAASAGGGIFCNQSSPTIRHNKIGDNAAYTGGGISCDGGTPVIEDNEFGNNDAETSGGTLFLFQSSPTIRRCQFTDSSVFPGGNGGAIYAANSTTALGHCAFIICSAADGSGGALFLEGGTADLDHCTIAAGSATLGGGIRCQQADLTLTNSIIAFCAPGGGISVSGNAPTVAYCDLYDNTGGDWTDYLPTGGGNISLDPQFVDIQEGDVHLRSVTGRWDQSTGTWVTDTLHSPCIDAGDPAADFSAEPAPNGSRVDMGAYGNTGEASKTYHLAAADVDGDGRLGSADLGAFVRAWRVYAGGGSVNARADLIADNRIGAADAQELLRLLPPGAGW